MLRQAFLALLLLVSPGARSVAGPAPACPAAVEIATPEAAVGTLPHVAAALKAGRLDVLAIGSGTMLGARGQPEGSFPDRMAQDLRTLLPGTDIRLTVQGERGMTAAAMFPLLRRNLAGRGFALVVWQTGTVEAVRKVPPEEFARTLDEGAAAVRAAGADLVLVDQQYSRMLQTHAALQPYREAMQAAAQRQHAVLFRRFDLVREWAQAGDLDLESAAKPDRPKVTEQLSACLGQALAQTVLRAAGSTQR